jgi:CheY-like chemotaxis protein
MKNHKNDFMKKKIQPQILIVDDDENQRKIANKYLTELGLRVLNAENGVQALQMLKYHCPDIILLDVIMPELDGFATTLAVRQLAGFETIPILIMTSLDDHDSINRAYETGATDFITKPITNTANKYTNYFSFMV